MSQPGKRKNKSLLDFCSEKYRDDSTENVTVCRDVKAASSVSAELACSSANDKQATRQFYRRISVVQPAATI